MSLSAQAPINTDNDPPYKALQPAHYAPAMVALRPASYLMGSPADEKDRSSDESDKLSVVDVKARDSQERLYQIEIQLTAYRHLPARIVYNWADIYSQQLRSGDDYAQLQPTYAIWLLTENLLSDDKNYVHHYKMRDEHGRTFQEHGGIWLLELNKFKAQRIETEEQRWLKFFKDGEGLNDESLPDWMSTEEMRQAMSTLSLFSEKERQYFQYQARQEYLREQRTKQLEYEQVRQSMEDARQSEEEARKQAEIARQETQLARQEVDMARQEVEAAKHEIERLKALLAKQ